ncbi:MAG: DUF1016 family protein [Paludibacteraceae bacterium]|nr:DUF1016 family protein [Paludibacteraceae bacterium]
MKRYNRIMLGRSGIYADECRQDGYIGVNFLPNHDLNGHLPEDWKAFNKEFVPVYLSENVGKTKVAAGLSCGYLWTFSKGLETGDVVLCPNGRGEYYVGEICSGYYYVPGTNLCHRRKVQWYDKGILRSEMSEGLRNSTGSTGTCCEVTKYQAEIDALIKNVAPATIVATSEQIEDPSAFALEKHLEDFLVKNWKHLELGKKYDIFEDNGEMVGEQYLTDTGPIDILAVSKDKKTILVIELKRGQATDVVVGQIQRYMGYVKEELADKGQSVKGIIIGLEADTRLKRALAVCPDISFYQYQISFKLVKGI